MSTEDLKVILFMYHCPDGDFPTRQLDFEPTFRDKEQCDRFLFRVYYNLKNVILASGSPNYGGGFPEYSRYRVMAKNSYRDHSELALYTLYAKQNPVGLVGELQKVYQNEAWAWED